MLLDISKSYDFFQPEKITERIHIIGCGSVGSTVAENLVRCGLTKLTLWDMDKVEPHNVANQMFTQKDVGKLKVDALKDILLAINPTLPELITEPNGWQGKKLSGYLFLCVDSIELRRQIVENHMKTPFVKAVFDFRTGLETAQHYAADWSDDKLKENLLKSMSFSDDEANQQTPVSACGTTLGVATTVRVISAIGVNNFINFTKGNGIKKFILIDSFQPYIEAF